MNLGRASLVLPLAAVAVLLIAGCGGGGGGDESSETKSVSEATTTGLSKAETIEQGDAICAESNAAIASVGADTSKTAEETAEETAELYIGMVKSLRALSPSEEPVAYAEFVAVASELEAAEIDVEVPESERVAAGLKEAELKASSALSKFQEAASEYGFKACAEDPSAPAASGSEAGGAEAGATEEGGVEVEPEVAEPEVEAEQAPEPAPETGGGAGAIEGGGTGTEGGGETGSGGSGGIGPG